MDGVAFANTVSLIIPAYNEEAGIAQAAIEADDALRLLGVPYEILIVDDGSRDATAQAVRETSRAKPSVMLLRHAVNRGYGAALRTGFEAARGERVAFTDADCQFHLADLAVLLVLTDSHPIAVGYRVDRQDTWLRKFYSRGYNLLVRLLLGTMVRDIDCALKVFRRDALLCVLPDTRGFFVNTEMLTRARQLGIAVAEAGVRHRPRLRGMSKVSMLDIPRTLKALLPFWWLTRKRGLEGSDNVVDTSGAERRQSALQLLNQPHRYRRVEEIRGADLHGAGAGDEELHHIVDGRDAADADDGNLDRTGNLPDQP
jgi:cellulose synthase/poly-beta-1,6-N-acetylglucosamine synthase-like glycosyltransferase